jgi:hypothetical protein
VIPGSPGRCPGLICGFPFGATYKDAGIDATVSNGARRFSHLRRQIAGIGEDAYPAAPRAAIRRDRARKDFQVVPSHVEYALTEFGETLRDALVPLCDWGHANQDRIVAQQV